MPLTQYQQKELKVIWEETSDLVGNKIAEKVKKMTQIDEISV